MILRSVVFPQPTYQNAFGSGSGRIVPDVGMEVGGCPFGLARNPSHARSRQASGSGDTELGRCSCPYSDFNHF